MSRSVAYRSQHRLWEGLDRRFSYQDHVRSLNATVPSVGICHVVESSVITWSLDHLMRVMAATSTQIAVLKEELAGVVAEEILSVAQRRV